VSLEERLDELERRLMEIEAEWSRPEVASDPTRSRELGREQSHLAPIVDEYRRLREVRAERDSARRSRDTETDPELHQMAAEMLEDAERREAELLLSLQALLLPRDPNDARNVIMEIRAGVGGEEAALFAAELYRMYQRYAERRRWKTDLITVSETGIGGIKEVIFELRGDGAYSRLKYEAGPHRVQRVPETESSGRLHTSTATVAVLPEADEVEVQIDDKDLRIDVYRSQGPGGQSVNTTDSAVRITHLPTGLVVTCQDEKSQIKNKVKAMKVLRARLYDKMMAEQMEKITAERRSMVSTGDRSAKIRTYNFPQSRVTDHRIGLTLYKLGEVLEGNIDEVVEALRQHEQEETLKLQGQTETIK
jgi:peptide chain release factor 1